MSLPTKGSRFITIANTAYRWLVAADRIHLRLIAELRENPRQRLIASFHHHDSYVRDPAGQWHRSAQLRSIAPALVRASILLALERGWQPHKKGLGAFELHDAEYHFPVAPPADAVGVQLVEFAEKAVGDLRFDVSVSPDFRRRLFDSKQGERFDVPLPNPHDLHFAAFFDGRTADGDWVIGIECVEFPHVVMYTFNGSGFL